MIRKPINIFLIILSLFLLSGCSSNIEELRSVRDKHNRDVEYIITQQEVNKDIIDKFKNEVIEYLKGNSAITSIDVSKIRPGERVTEVLEEVKYEIDNEIQNRFEDSKALDGLFIWEDEGENELKDVDIEEIKEEYFNEVEFYTFQNLSNGEIELVLFYSVNGYRSGVFSITWLEQIGYNVSNRILR